MMVIGGGIGTGGMTGIETDEDRMIVIGIGSATIDMILATVRQKDVVRKDLRVP